LLSPVAADGFTAAIEGRYDEDAKELQVQLNSSNKQEWGRLRQIAGEVGRAVNLVRLHGPPVHGHALAVAGVPGQTERAPG
jgi:hypothetical protein